MRKSVPDGVERAASVVKQRSPLCSVRQDLAMGKGFGPLSEASERNAADWAKWTRVPGHDVYHDRLNWLAFRDLLPAAGRRTLDVGCGEAGSVAR